MDAATRAVAQGLQPGTLVLYETTLPVGTTRERLGALLKRGRADMGRDFALAFSPERVYSGRIFRDLAAYPKVVGGIDHEHGVSRGILCGGAGEARGAGPCATPRPPNW